ncbi:MAG: DNA cytosine methyltransferase [Ktedonobacteraceae bacterium]|nr:DNA cytosine methyltransferase [Ktedonobacteraceae bacterium]
MYFDQETGQLQRLRTQEVFRKTNWAQTQSGIILPIPSSEDEREEEVPEVQWQQTQSGIILPVAASSRPRQKPTCISLFTGAGGFDLGFHGSGWRIVAASDYDTSCAWTYCYNMGTRPIQMHFITPQDRERFVKQVVKPSQKSPKKTELQELVELDEQDRAYFHRHDKGPVELEDATPHYFLGDVRKLTGKTLLEAIGMQVGEPDCMIGGPPCQGFSMAGKRDVMDPRNSLVFEYARLIIEVRPKSMCMENVPGILSMVTPQGIPVVDAFCKILADGNYANYEALKQSLEHNAQSWGIIQDQGSSKAKSGKKGQKGEEEDEDGGGMTQMSLF